MEADPSTPQLVPKVLEKSRAVPLLTLKVGVVYRKGENVPIYNLDLPETGPNLLHNILQKTDSCQLPRRYMTSRTKNETPNDLALTTEPTNVCHLTTPPGSFPSAGHLGIGRWRVVDFTLRLLYS